MWQNDVKVVRAPMTLDATEARHPVERLALRFPGLLQILARGVWRLPPSQLRRAVVRRAVKLGWEAFNRRDIEVTFALYHQNCESSWPPEFIPLGLPPGTSGRDERIREQRKVFDDWRELRYEHDEYIDLGGGRLLTAGRMKGVGPSSGAEVDIAWVALLTTLDGQVVREQIFVDRQEALEAAGLSD
jgi:ketosteroid isomerase-like protein